MRINTIPTVFLTVGFFWSIHVGASEGGGGEIQYVGMVVWVLPVVGIGVLEAESLVFLVCCP